MKHRRPGQTVMQDDLFNHKRVNIRKDTGFEIEALHCRSIETTVVERYPRPVVIAIHSGIG